MSGNIYEYLMTISCLLTVFFSDQKKKKKVKMKTFGLAQTQKITGKENYIAKILFGKVILHFRKHTESLHC